MGSESIAHEGERNNCFSKIQPVGQKNIETKHLSLLFWFSKPALFATSGL